MPRPIKIVGKSYNKFGERIKKLLDVDIHQGLGCISVKGKKLFLMIDDYVNGITRVIHYDIINDKITLDQTLDNLVSWYDWQIFPISDNFSFLDIIGNYYKYDSDTNRYNKINLGTGYIFQFQILKDKILVSSYTGFYIFDLNGNLISNIPTHNPFFVYDKVSNKVYSFDVDVSEILEIDLTNYTYRVIGLPYGINLAFGFSLRRIPNTNKILAVDGANNKVYEIDLNTLSGIVRADLSQYPEVEYGIWYSYITEDCKLIFLVLRDITTRDYWETWVYDLEKKEFKLVFSTDYPYLIVGNDKLRRYLIKDQPYGYVVYIYDYKKDKILGVIKNFGWYDIKIDGNIWLEI
jgi:hypothetical protein